MWYTILAIGLVFLIIEMFTPTMFFLNFALASVFVAILSFFTNDIYVLISSFCFLSIILVFTLRPILIKKSSDIKMETGMKSKYIGKTAKAVDRIDKNSGFISIYDERWQARSADDNVIENGENVKITDHEGIILKVVKQ